MLQRIVKVFQSNFEIHKVNIDIDVKLRAINTPFKCLKGKSRIRNINPNAFITDMVANINKKGF